MGKFLSSLISALAIILLVPTGLILVSWNALPGEGLYGLKRGLENIAFVLTKDTPIATAFSLKFTDRRFSEANILLAQKGSTVGYTLLVSEAQKTKDVIVDKNDTQNADRLVAKINQYEKAIDEKRIELGSQQQIALAPTPFVLPTPIPTILRSVDKPPLMGATPVAQTNQTPSPATGITTLNQQTIEELDKTKKDLEKIKDGLNKELQEKNNKPSKKEEIDEQNSH